jgi:tRNA (guanine-N7-)-methyltransferase
MTLRYPYKWHERKVLIQDGVLFIPDCIDTYAPAEIVFENDNPVHVEYCSGNGAWISSKALEFPHINWIAVEKKFERVSKIWNKIKAHQLKNLFIICGEGLNATQRYFKENSIAHVYVNFPDPWPKKRHWKHRIIQQPFLNEMHRVLADKGRLTFVTDDLDYSAVMREELHLSSKFTPFSPVLTELPGYGSSFFEQMWRAKGKPIFYHQWEMGDLCAKS